MRSLHILSSSDLLLTRAIGNQFACGWTGILIVSSGAMGRGVNPSCSVINPETVKELRWGTTEAQLAFAVVQSGQLVWWSLSWLMTGRLSWIEE